MEFSFTEALRLLGPDAAFTLMNMARAPQSYVFAQFLPERTRTTYEVKSGSMTVRPTMAGLVSMDSPYPAGGKVDISTFLQNSAKIATSITLSEVALRAIQDIWTQLRLSGGNTNEALVQEALNFTNLLLIQAHLDTFEYLRGKVFTTGAIDWTFNGIKLAVDYSVPSANKLTARTGNDGYGGSASKFWTDLRLIRKQLKHNLRALLVHPDTAYMIIYNSANSLQVINETNTSITVQRLTGSTERASTDARDTVTLILYGAEGEIIDPANPKVPQKLPFLPTGKLVGVANNTGTAYVVGAGAQQVNEYELGYTHLAPTVEGSGKPGRWARLFTPEARPYQLTGEAVTNGLPVLEAPDKICIATTEMV